MAEESDPVGPHELLLRRILNRQPDYIDMSLPMPVMRLAFRPTDTDVNGLSLFRSLFSTPRDIVQSGHNPAGYYVSELPHDGIVKIRCDRTT